MTRRSALTAPMLLLGALALSSCTMTSPVQPTETPAAAAEQTQTATPAASPTPTPSPERSSPAPSTTAPTVDTIDCDTMLDPTVDAELRAEGFVPAPKPWTQFGFAPSGAAIECPWGEPGEFHPARYYAWAALNPGEREVFASLVGQSGYYTAEESPVGTWFVETQPGPPGAEGFLLTDEWVVIADTREMVPDVLWTR